MKKFAWTFDIDNEDISGEADTREEAEKQMAACGYVADEMEGAIAERSDEEMVAHAQAVAAGPTRSRTSLQELANANATLFGQVDGLKNTVGELEMKVASALFDRRMFHLALIDIEVLLNGLRDLVIAWNTEQHARMGAAHREPAFVVMLREFKGIKALEKRKERNEQAKETENAAAV